MSDTISITSISLADTKSGQQEFDFSTNTMASGSVDTFSIDSSIYNYPSVTGPGIFTPTTGNPFVITDTTAGYETITIGPNYSNGQLKVSGNAEIDGELTIKGVKLSERLDKIEERLAILRPNENLEEKWDELRELGERYRKLENEIIEKQKVWEILKK